MNSLHTFFLTTILFSLSAFTFSECAHASALESMFRSLGSDINVTESGSFKDQAAGYYTGGGVMIRNRNTTFRPVEVSLPRLGVGCNGLDMYMGSMSFFKAEEFSNLLRSMAVSAPSYALQLALKTMSPQIETLLASLRKSVMDLNGLMLDSCQMSQQLVGGAWPKNSAASEQICQDMKRQGGEDFFGARKHCTPERVADHVDEALALEANRDLLAGEFNLTWKIAKDKLGLDDEMAHFALTTLGTVISIKEGHTHRLHYVRGLADSLSFIEAHINGGETTSRVCDETSRCLHVSDRRNLITKDHTLQERFAGLIDELFDAYIHDRRPSDAALVLIKDDMGLPIYSYIQIASSLGSRFMLHDAVEYMGVLVLVTHLEKMAFEVERALNVLQGVQIQDDIVKDFKRHIRDLRSNLHKIQSSLKADSLYRLNEMMKGFETTIIAKETL